MYFIETKVTWQDNSSGPRNETGQEIQIYTDSPSFAPNVPINYADAPHPWMALPPIAAGLTEAALKLETPVSFVTIRVRQFNADSFGQWSSRAGTKFNIVPPSGPNDPDAPSNVGFVVVTGGTTTPPDPPVDPPPNPPPTGGGGSSSNYAYQTQFSGVQGQNQWSYLDTDEVPLVFNVAQNKWEGNELYLAIWSNGFHHGASGSHKGAVVRWTAPAAGQVQINGVAKLYAGDAGATFAVKKNGSNLFSQPMTGTTEYPYSPSSTVVQGDKIDFVLTENVWPGNNNAQLNPVIQFTTDGTTPQNPTISSLAPSAATIGTGGTAAMSVSLSSPATETAVISLGSSDSGKASVPATVTIPQGQISVQFTVTGVAIGSSTITATYNSSNKQSVITVSAPVSALWPNAPVGGVELLNWPFNTVLGPGMSGGTSNGGITTDATAPLSPPSVYVSRLNALAKQGGSQLNYIVPGGVTYREMYVGWRWRTNPQFQGRIVANKLFFIRGNIGTNGFWGMNGGPNQLQPSFYLMFGPNSGGLNNAHLLGDPIGTAFPNTGGNATLQVGVWTKLEASIRCSTTPTSRDGTVKWWVNDALVGHYEGFNYCGPNGETLNTVIWSETWDGSGDLGSSNTVVWEHYIDQMIVVGKN